MTERQITFAPHGHLLTNAGVWTADGEWLVYDIRSDAAGASFDGTRIERVEAATGRVEVLYESVDGACCGVVTVSPVDDRVVFILGPEHPTADWRYGPARRRGVIVRSGAPGAIEPLDARDLVLPFTPGALRGGTHVHQFSPDGRMVSFTYEDALLDMAAGADGHQRNLRAVGVSVCGRQVSVPRSHPRNHDGGAWSVLVTDLVDEPPCGSDAISRACEEAWIGTAGYRHRDGSRQQRALAFQGTVVTPDGEAISEVFIVDLPDADAPAGCLDTPANGPLVGTPTTRPYPPAGVAQRRITFTARRVHPGIQGPRHWLRSSPDGDRIAFLARDDVGVVQLFTASPLGGEPRQVTHERSSLESAFTWSPAGDRLACVIDGSVCLVDARDGRVLRLTPQKGEPAPRPEACVFSPDGRRVAYLRRVGSTAGEFNQVFTVDVPD
jgi:dipeptidyl aminopeptidase/acylaminoacyl peptidase